MRFFIFILGALVLPVAVSAAASDFGVTQLVTGDVQAPTTPVIVSVTPLTASQVDITWSPSTDDVQLTGYTVMRDGVHIATTTLTTFSDTGLSPLTLYQYTVQAFDWIGNISSTSLPVSTTTLAVPVIPPTPTSTPSTTVSRTVLASGRLMLSHAVVVTTDLTSVTMEWGTSRPSRFELRWGRTSSYELGFVTTERYREDHLTTLTDLIPGTTYYYELVGYSTLNDIPQVLSRGQFTTRVPAVATQPPNVLWFTAGVEGTNVALHWQNPDISGEYFVRVLRNHLQYPEDQHDGMIVYQGRAQDFLDSSALTAYDHQYYAVYVVDALGNISSGAIAQAWRAGTDTSKVAGIPGGALWVDAPEVLLPLLDPSMIWLQQDGNIQSFADTTLVLSSTEPFVLSIPAAQLPGQLKSIIVTLLDPTDHKKSYTFLLRLNSSKTAYETTLAPITLGGVSRLMVEIYDFKANVVGRYGKQVEFVPGIAGGKQVIFPDLFMPYLQFRFFLYAASLLLLGGLLMKWWYQRLRAT